MNTDPFPSFPRIFEIFLFIKYSNGVVLKKNWYSLTKKRGTDNKTIILIFPEQYGTQKLEINFCMYIKIRWTINKY